MTPSAGQGRRPAAPTRPRVLAGGVAVALSLLTIAPAAAHDLEFTSTVVILRPDGTYQIDVTCDLDALALGVAQGVDSAQVVRLLRELTPEELERRFARARRMVRERVRIRFDGAAADAALTLPEHGAPHAVSPEVPTILGLTARFTGAIPAAARALTVEVDRSLPPAYLTIIDQRTDESAQQILQRGAESDPYPLGVDVPRPVTGGWSVVGEYLSLGVWHIVPEGVDHMLFVLGLFLLSPRVRPLLLQVSVFTVAHTVTLALSSYDLVRLSPALVEPLIALSIACVAVENLFSSELTPWRPAVVFLFGLLHGMGFAGVLGELGLPRDAFLVALVAFNGGVEVGQLGVLALAFLTIGQLRTRPWYRRGVTVPVSMVIAVIGVYWAVDRAFSAG